MLLADAYDQAVASQDIQEDTQQRQILPVLQRIMDDLASSSAHWFNRIYKKKVQGLYLYGPVGAGKTWLVDLFYEHLSEPRKSRYHFHHFMQQIDAQLRRFQGQKNPVKKIARDFAKSTRLLCLDEFLIHDVADAMILAEVLKELFNQGVTMIASTNTAPDDLYRDGVHRERFLPAIDLIKSHCHIISITESRDYRLGRAPQLQSWLQPLNQASSQSLVQQFATLARNAQPSGEILIQQRLIPYIQSSDNAIWFNFNILCNIPRSQLDYLELADRFDTIFMSDIPILSGDDTTRAIMFIHLIDVMYDRGLRLIASAAGPASQIYTAGAMIKSFQRTLSRLEEMQSADYLRRHKYGLYPDFSFSSLGRRENY